MPKCSGIYLSNIQKSIAKASKSVSTRFLRHDTEIGKIDLVTFLHNKDNDKIKKPNLTSRVITVHVLYIRNFDMGRNKVNVHSTYTTDVMSGWSVT